MIIIQNKTALITGASRGIGEATARHFAAQGANVVLAARSSEDINRIASEIGENAVAVTCDVGDAASVQNAVDQTISAFGGLDILVNNAGILEPVGRLADLAISDWDKVIDVNVKGVFYGIKSALPHMAKNGGTMVHIGSGAATSALEGWSHYCASKAAVHHLNVCLDLEMREKGIRSLILSPGTVATQMQRVIKASGINPVSTMNWEDHIPTEWVARCIEWMCSPDSDEWLGKTVPLRDEDVRQRIGLTA